MYGYMFVKPTIKYLYALIQNQNGCVRLLEQSDLISDIDVANLITIGRFSFIASYFNLQSMLQIPNTMSWLTNQIRLLYLRNRVNTFGVGGLAIEYATHPK